MKKLIIVILTTFMFTNVFAAENKIPTKKNNRDLAASSVNLSPGLSLLMLNELQKNRSFDGGTNQGWLSSGAIIRCYDPQGTGNSSDKAYCSLEPIK